MIYNYDFREYLDQLIRIRVDVDFSNAVSSKVTLGIYSVNFLLSIWSTQRREAILLLHGRRTT